MTEPKNESTQLDPVENAKLILIVGAFLGVVAIVVLVLYPFREVVPAVDLGAFTVEARDSKLSKEAMLAGFVEPAERALKSISAVQTVVSRTADGSAAMVVTLAEDAPLSVSSQIESAVKQLKDSVRVTPISTSEADSVTVYLIFLPEERLEAAANRLKKVLEKTPFISEVQMNDEPRPVIVRLNGQVAVRMKASKRAGADTLLMVKAIEKATATLADEEPGLKVWIDDRLPQRLKHRLNLVTVAAAAGLFIFTLVFFGVYRDIAVFGLFLLCIVGPSVSLLILRLLEISINEATLISLIGSFGIVLSIGAVTFGFYRRRRATGIKALTVPLALSAVAAGLSVMPFYFLGGVLGRMAKGPVLSIVIVLVVSTAVFAVMIPHLMKLCAAPLPLPMNAYRALMNALLDRRILRAAAWILPQGVLVFMLIAVFSRLVGFEFMPKAKTERLSVWIACDGQSSSAAIRQIEARLKGHEGDIDQVIVAEGVASGPYHTMPRFGSEVAQLEIIIKRDGSGEPISKLFPKEERPAGCDMVSEDTTSGGFSKPSGIHISGRDPETIEEIAQTLEKGISDTFSFLPARSVTFRWEMEKDAVMRRNGLPTATLFVEAETVSDLPRKLAEVAASVQDHFRDYVIETDQSEKKTANSFGRLFISFAIAALGILVIHVIACALYRSFLPGFLLLSPLYLFSSVFLVSKNISAMSLFAVLFVPPILGTIVMMFLPLIREEKKEADRDAILSCRTQLFRATAPILCALMTSAAVLSVNDAFLRPLMEALISGLLMLFYFIWILMPLGRGRSSM